MNSMKKVIPFHLVLMVMVSACASSNPKAVRPGPESAPSGEDPGLISGVRQLTFAGERAGEGYFGPGGKKLIFQSEREPGNPFFQIYLMDMADGNVRRLSPGTGRTTCSWLHPDGKRAMFSSSHEDPDAKEVQKKEIERRKSGKASHHRWVYDEHFDIYQADLASGDLKNLSPARGYDAEGSYSPDGSKILFASNRHAYSQKLSPEEKAKFDKDPSVQMDLYMMDADGSNLKRLTDAPGQDGGPFFSADGKRIVWRRFSEDGLRAEIRTMMADGTGEKQLTHLGVMSWAPFFHPSGRYVIFTTNKHGFEDFELYLVDAEGKKEPVRAVVRPGFDGLPAFSPDGKHLAWTSNRTVNGKGQIFLADWDHHKALALLGLASDEDVWVQDVFGAGEPGELDLFDPDKPHPEIHEGDLRRHIQTLASAEMDGRLTGTAGEKKATEYVASVFERLGLEPAGDDGTYFQSFPFTSGVELGKNNRLLVRRGPAEERVLEVGKDWTPLSFSANGKFGEGQLVFAGYGIVAPATANHPAYDSYKGIDVKDKWVIVFRYLPGGLSQEYRLHLAQFSGLRHKAMLARERGAKGLMVVSGPLSQVRKELVPLVIEGTPQGGTLPAISVTDEVLSQWLANHYIDMKKLQEQWEGGVHVNGSAIEASTISGSIDVVKKKGKGRNVLARLEAPEPSSPHTLVVGAHVDHIGHGEGMGSLAKEEEKGLVHFGADDNASGVAGVLEIAEFLVHQVKEGKLVLKHDILFAAWSGEELGLLGSTHFVRTASGDRKTLYPQIAACLNMDMIGRMTDRLTLYGLGSSSAWAPLIERHNVPLGLPVVVQEESTLPTDATAFTLVGVPILSAFTGLHLDYNTPRDTADRILYPQAAKVVRLLAGVIRDLAGEDSIPDYRQPAKKAAKRMKGHQGRVYLGTIPDFSSVDVIGVKLAGAKKDSPAEKAGIKTGDIVTELAGKKIENLYDYSFAIGALQIGKPAQIVIRRGDQTLKLTITPGSRE